MGSRRRRRDRRAFGWKTGDSPRRSWFFVSRQSATILLVIAGHIACTVFARQNPRIVCGVRAFWCDANYRAIIVQDNMPETNLFTRRNKNKNKTENRKKEKEKHKGIKINKFRRQSTIDAVRRKRCCRCCFVLEEKTRQQARQVPRLNEEAKRTHAVATAMVNQPISKGCPPFLSNRKTGSKHHWTTRQGRRQQQN